MPESQPYERTPGAWEKIVVETDSRMTEAVAAYLAEISGTGVEISAAPEGPAAEKNPATLEKVIAYIPLGGSEAEKITAAEKAGELRDFLDRLAGIFPECPVPTFTTGILEEEDWSRVWKSFFTTFQVTPTLAIKPSWEEPSEKSGPGDTSRLVIEMDPGLAFGTGHHASTRLALMLLEQLFEKDGERKLVNILDVGTGSGILAMGCGLFGARNVLAVDNDPDAVAVAEANITRNRLEGKIKVSGRDIATLKDEFDLIVANITHDTLAAMASVLSGLLASGGWLVLSGILKDGQADSIREIYSGKGMNFIKSITRDEWAALQFMKNGQ